MVDMLHQNGFDGNLFLAGINKNDDFTKIARHIDNNKEFKYMVAIRSYTISPQYLSMICNSIDEISPNKIQINLLTGWIKDDEKNVGGIVGDINDLSDTIDKSNYMIKFLETISKMEVLRCPDLYVSCTNKFVFNAAKEHGKKVILPYSKYKTGEYDVIQNKTIVSIGPILKDNSVDKINNSSCFIGHAPMDSEFFTKDEFMLFLDNLYLKGFEGVLLYGWPVETENEKIISFVKEYKTLKFGANIHQ